MRTPRRRIIAGRQVPVGNGHRESVSDRWSFGNDSVARFSSRARPIRLARSHIGYGITRPMSRVPHGTLIEILGIENRWVRLAEICNHIIGKVDRRGASCLTPVERTIDRVNDFEYRMIQGG